MRLTSLPRVLRAWLNERQRRARIHKNYRALHKLMTEERRNALDWLRWIDR